LSTSLTCGNIFWGKNEAFPQLSCKEETTVFKDVTLSIWASYLFIGCIIPGMTSHLSPWQV
jgi:hypothetical protein